MLQHAYREFYNEEGVTQVRPKGMVPRRSVCVCVCVCVVCHVCTYILRCSDGLYLSSAKPGNASGTVSFLGESTTDFFYFGV